MPAEIISFSFAPKHTANSWKGVLSKFSAPLACDVRLRRSHTFTVQSSEAEASMCGEKRDTATAFTKSVCALMRLIRSHVLMSHTHTDLSVDDVIISL